MIHEICTDEALLAQRAAPATADDLAVARDLLDTLMAHRDGCVGMAANMIGINKRIIAIAIGPMVIPMLNPIITAKSDPYEAEEGCLSLSGIRQTTRYQKIEVTYQDLSLKTHHQTYEDFVAQIIQHEIDHLDGILI